MSSSKALRGEKIGMKGRMLMDFQFLTSAQGLKFIAKFGTESAISIFTLIHAYLTESEDSTLKFEDLEGIAFHYRLDTEKVIAVVTYLVELGYLLSDGESFYSQLIKDDRAKLEQKRETYRANAQQRSSNSKAIAQPLLSKSNEPELEPEPEYEVKKIDDITRDQVLLVWRPLKLDESDLPQALIELSRHYRDHPNKRRPGSEGLDLCSSWLTRVLIARKNEQAKLIRNSSPPKTQEDEWALLRKNKTETKEVPC